MIAHTPQTFHQIWLGTKPIPVALSGYQKTWQYHHPQWDFEIWDDEKSNLLVREKHSHLLPLYESLPYLTQRVDIINQNRRSSSFPLTVITLPHTAGRYHQVFGAV